MLKAILLGVMVVLAASQSTTPLVGGYQSYTDLSSQEFQSVLSFIYDSNPELKGYTPTTVQRQLVNGFNYRIQLQNSDGCTTQVNLYATFQNDYSISSIDTPVCPTNTLPPKVSVITPNPLSGAYRVHSSPQGEDFESALASALSQNNYRRSDLVLTESQVVAGTNYRFTFRNQDGSLSQVVIFVPLGGIPALAPQAVLAPADGISPLPIAVSTPLRTGGWKELSNQNSYKDVLEAIYKAYPQVKRYHVSGVESQVVAGMNYRVSLQLNNANTTNYALFNVYVDLRGVATVELVQWISVSSYSVQQLIDNQNNSLQLHSQVKGFTLSRIENIWQREGLKFTFSQGSKKYLVFIYSKNGQLRNLIY